MKQNSTSRCGHPSSPRWH